MEVWSLNNHKMSQGPPMFPDDESSEEHPDSFYQDGSYEEDDSPSGKGCLAAMAIILILSLLLRFLQASQGFNKK